LIEADLRRSSMVIKGSLLGRVENGSRIFVFSRLGWVMGLKWQIAKNRCRDGVHM